jgi:outer membrane protein
MNKPKFLIGPVLAAAVALLPATASALDLLQSYEAALQVDPDMLAAEQALLAGREKARQGNSLIQPKLNLSASLTEVDNRSTTGLPSVFSDLIKSDSRGTVHETELQLQQPLYDPESWAERRQLHEQSDLAEVEYHDAQQNLIERVSQTYLGVLLAQESLRVVQAEKAAVQMQRDRAQARFDVGRGKITDLHEAQARYDSVLSREVSAVSTLSIRQAQFEELTGMPARGLALMRDGLPLSSPQPDDLSVWQSRGLDHSPHVLAKRGELAIATAEIDKYRLSARPTLDLVASYNHSGQDGGLSPAISADSSDTSVIGLQLNIPLFTGGALESRKREAVAKERQARQELGAAQRDVRLQVQDAFLEVNTGVTHVRALEQSALSAQSALEATTLGRDVGSRTELDVLDAQQRLYTAQLDLAQARHDYLMGRIQLAAAVGELKIDDLQLLNACLLDPAPVTRPAEGGR